MMKALWVFALIGNLCLVTKWGAQEGGLSAVAAAAAVAANATTSPLFVDLTLIQSAVAKGAVCLDGTPPGYHLHRGHGSGANSWLVGLEGGGWCNDIESCVDRKATYVGSSTYMDPTMQFTAILSNKHEENPDFYNWNRVWIRYCDGASFAGEGYNESQSLYFRGQRIWSVVMEELMLKGMRSADKALLTGCSAGGLATIIHCDEFRALFPASTKVKCMADAGLFLDVANVAGQHGLRSIYEGVVSLQGVARNLPASCTTKMDPALCFFPQHLLKTIQTPMFILNSAYDSWQIQNSLAPPSADPAGHWQECAQNLLECNAHQINFLQGFRNVMLKVVRGSSASKQNGLFINSCFYHCQIQYQSTWYGENSPAIANKRIAESVGDWYFDRAQVKAIDCPYPCNNTC